MAPVSRDIYRKDVDFTVLAFQYPEFAKRYVGTGSLRDNWMVLTLSD